MAPIEAGRHRRPASSFLARTIGILAIVALAGACGGRSATPSTAPSRSVAPTPTVGGPPPTPEPTAALTPVRIQLRGGVDATAAGYLAAIEQGYYESDGMAVTIVPRNLAGHGSGAAGLPGAGSPAAAEFVVDWVPTILAVRDRGDSDLVDIGQIAQRSGTLSMAWKSEEITTPADMRDKRLGILASGSEYEITAALKRAGLTPGTDVTTVETGPTVAAFLHGEVDTAQALIYDQYAQVLEAGDPKTGALYAPTALDVINYNDVGTAMLQDAIFARAGWLDDPVNEELATVFLKASFEGWIYCREHPDDCVGYAATAAANQPPQGGPGPSGGPSPGAGGSAAASPPASASAIPPPSAGASGEPIPGTGHQAWMLNELNPLIWPSPDGIGVVDRDGWQATVGVLRSSGLIAADPPTEAYRTDLASAALARLTDTDTTGAAFVKGTVEITPGGD